jgi:hypothetical protein
MVTIPETVEPVAGETIVTAVAIARVSNNKQMKNAISRIAFPFFRSTLANIKYLARFHDPNICKSAPTSWAQISDGATSIAHPLSHPSSQRHSLSFSWYVERRDRAAVRPSRRSIQS